MVQLPVAVPVAVAEADLTLLQAGFTASSWLRFFGGVSHAVVAEKAAGNAAERVAA